ncbi:MAG: YdiU family protein [Candidatus Dadabacteria bacterium]|nr:YdiU family protein [Candidatus Dadabacteria bacterium]NIS08879.1 YdiU family protein [Candidatus Dadabacteria bacterium]NIV42578.1 YdiU family protein [Candidatus Dadabacteria bacterium]NIY22222.1 YdiU family protein [Candidatus Dadabacteria bacterium]
MKNTLTELNFNNTYSELPDEFYHRIEPTSFSSPRLVIFNSDVSELIGLDPAESDKKYFSEYISGKKKIPGTSPIAMYYTGHQFGVYNKDIGDGRAILLGEVVNPKGQKWDLHLKGAGRTKYSRQFDGRAVLRSCIREYLCGEAIHYLRIPTTRSLCIIGSDEIVQRETPEMGAMLLRVARSHVRFGSFEGFYYKEQYENIRILADYVIENHFPEFIEAGNKYAELYKEIIRKTAKLIAYWQAYGFVHGVMNTDNMSVLGLTFDYGPYGFVEQFDPNFIPNHSDHHGRYSLRNQKSIAHWNLQKLGKCLGKLVSTKEIRDALDLYIEAYRDNYGELMRKKMGLAMQKDEDWQLIEIMLECLYNSNADYTNFFRNLSSFDEEDFKTETDLSHMFSGSDYGRWASFYSKRLKEELGSKTERKKLMNSVNPKYILRNYIAQIAIEKAQQGDYTEISKVYKILRSPFSEQPEHGEYSKPAPDKYRNLSLSCSA